MAGFPVESWEKSGNLDVYLVTDTTTSIDNGTSPLVYDSTDDPTSGLGSQLGTTYLLGTIGFSNSQTTDNFTSFPLTNANSTALGMLTNALNNGTTFRIVVALSGDAGSASLEGFYTDTQTELFEAPIVSFNYTPASEITSAFPPTVAKGGGTATYTIGGSAATVDSGVTMSTTESDGDITGAVMELTNYQTGDTLNFSSPTDSVTGSWNAVNDSLVLSGTTSAANYQAAMRTVTFSTTNNTVTTPRTISVQGSDTFASPTTGNSVTETVDVDLAPPSVTSSGSAAQYTAGANAVTVDPGITVTSPSSAGPTSSTGIVTSATMTISPGTLQSGDSLNFTNGTITGVYTAGTGTLVLTGTGSTTAAQFQTALRSVTFSSGSTSTVTRSISVVAADSNANTPGTASNTASDTVDVFAPLEVTALYAKGTSWGTNFYTYLSSNGLGSTSTPTLGFALQTGSLQSKTLPWVNVNVIEATFNEAPTGISISSLVLSGGTGGSTPTVTGFSQLSSTTYAWTLSTSLTKNRLEISFLNSGLTDSRGRTCRATGPTAPARSPRVTVWPAPAPVVPAARATSTSCSTRCLATRCGVARSSTRPITSTCEPRTTPRTPAPITTPITTWLGLGSSTRPITSTYVPGTTTRCPAMPLVRRLLEWAAWDRMTPRTWAGRCWRCRKVRPARPGRPRRRRGATRRRAAAVRVRRRAAARRAVPAAVRAVRRRRRRAVLRTLTPRTRPFRTSTWPICGREAYSSSQSGVQGYARRVRQRPPGVFRS